MNFLKKSICLLLAAATLSLCGCSQEAPETTAVETESTAPTIDRSKPLSDGKTLKMLAITSSFGLNTTQLLYDVAVSEGCTDVVVGRLYYSGCTLQRHVEYAQNNAMEYQYTKISDSRYETKEGYSLKFGLQDEDWDIIYIQQGAANAGIESTYGDYLDQLMVYIHEYKPNPNARFVWNMTWAYQGDSDQNVFVNTYNCDQMAMYDAIVSTTKNKILPRTDIERIIPSGTAIQNARTSTFGDHLCKDTYHLNNYGAIFTAYCTYAILTDTEITEVKLDAEAASKRNGINGADPITRPLTEEQKAIIIECVNNAIKNPFEVTPSAYTGK